MNRADQINKFFNDYYNIIVSYPHFLDSNRIYHYLIRMGTTEQKYNYNEKVVNNTAFDLEQMNYFDNWAKKFADSNTNVFVSPNWKYFCQFTDKKGPEANLEAIKVYLPLDICHMYEGVNEIFKFIDEKDMHHRSKVGKQIRFDSVVIRLFNKDDLIDLLNFVNNNPNIKEGLIDPNPFAFQCGNVALASDGMLSYNQTVSKYIYLYMQEKLKNPNSIFMSAEDFYAFVKDFYKRAFINKDVELAKTLFSDNANADIETFPYLLDKYIKNYQSVTALIINSNNREFTLNDYINHYETVRSGNTAHVKGEESMLEDPADVKYQENTAIVNETKGYLEIFSQKYGYDYSIAALSKYLETGDEKLITRYGNLRHFITTSDYRDKMLAYLKENGLSFQMFISIHFRASKSTDEMKSYMDNALVATYNKYGINQVMVAIERVLSEGNYRCFTNDNGCRDNLEMSITPSNFILYMESQGIILNREYVNDEALTNYINTLTMQSKSM